MLWYDYFQSVIQTNFGQETYTIIKTDQLVGLFTCLFVKATLIPRIRQCDSTTVKTGIRVMNKIHGNKGGIAIRLILNDASFCFVNCHLASGQSNWGSRNADLSDILQSARFPTFVALDPMGRPDPFLQQALFKAHSDGSYILDHETCFISGDFNYRIDMERQEILCMLQAHTKLEVWETLQREDQLKKQLTDPFFRHINLKEAPILFDPTYKYDKNTNEYDRSEKKRIPAWCDRILYRAPATVTNEYYRRHEVRISDHRPVSAGFIATVKQVNYERMENIKAMLKIEWEDCLKQLQKENKVHYVRQFSLCDEREALDRLEKTGWDIEKVVMDLFRDKGLCLP
ncbi:Endonuclease/exonuclease/phosphatase [Blakeslea trispora]|nr:Endonuclease/exonuclease/phosphatase [Blakeslea trispora]